MKVTVGLTILGFFNNQLVWNPEHPSKFLKAKGRVRKRDFEAFGISPKNYLKKIIVKPESVVVQSIVCDEATEPMPVEEIGRNRNN